jgi:cystathionine gamma-lyase
MDIKKLNAYNAIVPVISLASTFVQEDLEIEGEYCYSREGNPTRNCLEKKISKLEKADFGLVFSSGLSAITTIINTLSSGDKIICIDDVYGGTYRYFTQVCKKFGIEVIFVDLTNELLDISQYMNEKTKMIWIETPTNPLLKIVDIKRISEIAHKNNSIVVVDNTFLTPYFQLPLTFGADIVVHSVSKYLNGHSDVIMGAIMTLDPGIYESLKFLQNSLGTIPSPFDCYLVLRGLKTFSIRMEKHEKNANIIAHNLKIHKNILKVIYPGFDTHPQHKIAQEQQTGFGGMISFYLKVEDVKDCKKEVSKFFKNLKYISLAESLGGTDTLIECPALMTHKCVPDKEKSGITDNLIRLSVGIEDVDTILLDLYTSLDHFQI